jgi:hypothetical protein
MFNTLNTLIKEMDEQEFFIENENDILSESDEKFIDDIGKDVENKLNEDSVIKEDSMMEILIENELYDLVEYSMELVNEGDYTMDTSVDDIVESEDDMDLDDIRLDMDDEEVDSDDYDGMSEDELEAEDDMTSDEMLDFDF